MANQSDFDGGALPGGSRNVQRYEQPVVVRAGGGDYSAVGHYHGHGGGGDEQQRQQLAMLWGAILKHKWIIALIVGSALLVGLGSALLTTPLYTADTKIQIDRESAKVFEVEGMIPAEAMTGNEFLDTQIGLLESQSLAKKVVQSLKLRDNATFLEMAGVDPDEVRTMNAGALERQLTKTLSKNTAVKQEGLSRIVVISVTTPDPQLSAKLSNAFADNFISSSLERRYESSAYARRFLEDRLRVTKERLEQSEKELVAYAAKAGIVNVAQNTPSGDAAVQSLTASDLAATNSARALAQAERIKAEQRWHQARSTPLLSLPEALADPTVQNLRQQRAMLSAQYQERLKVYRPDFPDMQQLQAQIDEIDRQLNSVGAAILASIRSRYEIALRQEQSFNSQVGSLKGSFNDLRERNIQYTILQREVDTNRTLYDGLLQRYKEVGVAGGVGNNNVSIVDRATQPERPSSPRLMINLIIALAIGMAVAAAVTLVLELMDESIRTPDDVSSKLGLPLIGVVPELEKGITPNVALNDPRSALSEAYSSVRTSLQFATVDGLPPNLLITSSRPAEGKSTSALAIARSFAYLGMRVLLVDADLRNPSVHRVLGIENSEGLSNYLTGAELEAVVQSSDYAGLSVMPCGPLPPNPSELLAGPRFSELLREARNHFDLLIIDGPPVIGLADAPTLASKTAATLLVIQATGARRSVVRIATARLLQARAKLLGALLTRFNAQNVGYGYSYAYTYEYGPRRLEKDRA